MHVAIALLSMSFLPPGGTGTKQAPDSRAGPNRTVASAGDTGLSLARVAAKGSGQGMPAAA